MDAIVRPGAIIHDVSAYLTRFDAPPTAMTLDEEEDRAPAMESLFEAPEPVAPEPEPEPEPQVDREAIIAEFQARQEAALDAQRAEFEARLRDERERWATEQGAALSARLAQALDTAFEELRSDVARIISPFVAREVTGRVTEDLIAALRTGLANDGASAMEIRGPRDLLEKIESALASEPVAISCHESDEVDARVTFASTTVETSLSDWMNLLLRERGEKR